MPNWLLKMEDGEASEVKVAESNLDYTSLKRSLSAFFSILMLSFGFAIGYASTPTATGATIILSLIIYVFVFTLGPEIRVPFLSIAVGTHMGFLYVHRSSVKILPLFIISKDVLGGSLGLDFVQLATYIEIAVDILSHRRRSVKPEGFDKIKKEGET